MTTDILHDAGSQKRTIRLKRIRAVYETYKVEEDGTDYLRAGGRFTSPAQVFATFQFLMRETKENFVTLHLDCKNKIVCMDTVSIGSLNQSIVHPREVFKSACLSNAAAMILVHQHPSGDATPSREDLEITRRLKEAGELLGIRVLDHVIVGDGEYVSFVERGLL